MPARRRYADEDQERLRDRFGESERWSQTLRPLLWMHTSVVAPSFTGSSVINLQLPCTFDFNVAAAKYFAGLTDGEVPLNLMFSGTVFYASGEGALRQSDFDIKQVSAVGGTIKLKDELKFSFDIVAYRQ